MRIYISGPISGRPVEEYTQAFKMAEACIRGLGYTALNPVTLTAHLPEGSPWEDYMHESIKSLFYVADAIWYLPGWEGSRGCRIEHTIAQERGLVVFRQEEIDALDTVEQLAASMNC